MSALRKTLLFVAIVCLVLVAAAAVLVAAKLLGWPMARVVWWVALVAGLVLLAMLVRPVWRWLSARRARASETRNEVGALRLKELRERWNALLGQLKKSKLAAGGRGGAVAALPWYLLLGEEGSGKTTALRNSGCAVSVGAQIQPPGPGGCRLEWTFLEGGIALDAPGYYAFPRDDVDRAEWEGFLNLLGRAGRDTPLSGVVVTVAAQDLAQDGEEDLKRKAAALRQRLDELTRRLGVQAPVYVLVTQWDKIEGMARFFRCFPEEIQQQAVGSVREDRKTPAEAFGTQVVGRLKDRLAELRLVLLGDPVVRESHRQALLFPEDVAALQKPLGLFLGALFVEDPYREPPLFRGIYFSSGHQGGKGVAGYLAKLGFPEEEVQAPSEDRGYFLRDFFGRVLPRDKALAAPTARALSLRRLTQNVGLTVWLAVCLILGIVLTFSFARNLSALRAVSRDVPSKADLIGRPETDLAAVDRLRASVEKLEARNRGWGVGWLLLGQSRKAERALREEFDRRFRASVLVPQDRWLEADLSDVLRARQPDQIAAAIDFLVKRRDLLFAATTGDSVGSLQDLSKREQPDYGALIKEWERSDKVAVFRRNYLAHLAWGTEGNALADELSRQKGLLEKVTTSEGVALDWLIEWANRQKDLKPVRLSTFWEGEPAATDAQRTGEVLVPGAYTPAGADRIRSFLDRIATGAGDAPGFTRARTAFEAKYRGAYFDRWEAFLREFPQGETAWSGRERRAELASRLGGNTSPYVQLLAAAPEALKPALDLAGARGEVPGWAPLIFRYEGLREPEYQKVLKGGQGVVDKVASQGGVLFGKLREKLLGGATETASLAEDGRAYPYWTAFQDALAKMSERTRTPQAAYQVAKDTFAEVEMGVGEPQQPVSRAYWSLAGLKRTLGKGQPGEDVFWQLLSRQPDLIWSVILSQAEVAIQRVWESDVLAAAAGLSGLERVDALQGPSGKVWEFQEKVAGPFLLRSGRRRPEPKALYGQSVHFTGSFLELLARGKVGQQAIRGSSRVQISALPTDANPEALVKPDMTRLVLQCSSGAQELVNQNYPVSRTFNWSPEECSDVSLEIRIGTVLLRRWYSGYDGFAKFLADFRGGRRVFRASEFPDQKAALAANRLETITVAYTFRGQEGVVGSAATAPAAVPDRITP